MRVGLSCLAMDLGASSGRAILGRFDGSILHIQEIHRFANRPQLLPEGLHWNVQDLYQEILLSIAAASRQESLLTSLGIDSWGLDFALLDSAGALLGVPFHYRDVRTQGMMEKAFQRMPRSEIFALTGIQFMDDQ